MKFFSVWHLREWQKIWYNIGVDRGKVLCETHNERTHDMNAKEMMKAEIAKMSNAQLVATFNEVDAKVVSQRQNPAEWLVRFFICEEMDNRGINY